MRRRSRAGCETVKTRRRKTAARKHGNAPKVARHHGSSSTILNKQVALFKRERDEALEQLKAAADVLRVISSSPGELEPVFGAMLENATRICEAKSGFLFLAEMDDFRIVASLHQRADIQEQLKHRAFKFGPSTPIGRAALTRQIVHVPNLAEDRAYLEREPLAVWAVEQANVRTVLVVPLLKEEELIGVFGIEREEVKPFTDKQIELLKNFAAQAVIAIENTRLLDELRQRTDDLTESLDQQTATSEVLKVVSSSPGELEPVFETLLANAVRICGAKFGVLFLPEGNDAYRAVALHGAPPAFAEARQRDPLIRLNPATTLGRVAATKQVVQVEDIRADPGFTNDPKRYAVLNLAGARTMLNVPMLKDEELVGQIAIYRQEVRPFTDKQIDLVKNFAAQAVIAIENTRLLNELRQRTTDLAESLEQQTATSEVLRVISSTPGEVEPVFQAMLENAVRICQAKFGFMLRYAGGAYHTVAALCSVPAYAAEMRRGPLRPDPELSAWSRRQNWAGHPNCGHNGASALCRAQSNLRRRCRTRRYSDHSCRSDA